LYELENNTFVTRFNRNASPYVDLGWFMPGEGKLFKLEPVMRSGGILLADEAISGESFTCEDTVWNNGYNITINNSSIISFSDSASIIMDGGTFTSGGLSEPAPKQHTKRLSRDTPGTGLCLTMLR
jgi:hypothetical protein